MGKDLVKTDKSSEAKTDQTKNIVDKILKTKNRFRSGLGFKQGKSTKEEEKAKISQGISRKKILQGTRGDKTLDDDEEFLFNQQEVKNHEEIELGNRNYVSFNDADENVTLSQVAVQKKSKYYDPRAAFLEKIKNESITKS